MHNECLTTLSLAVCAQSNFAADFLQANCDFTPKTFLSLGTTYDDHFNFIGKRVVELLLVLIELFSLGVTAEALRANIVSKSAIFLQQGPVDPKF